VSPRSPTSEESPGIPEVVAVSEDHSNIAIRKGLAAPCSSDILSVYLEGGPCYRLGRCTYRFAAPAAILIPAGMMDDDRQEGKVNGMVVFFRGGGLLRPGPGQAGRKVSVRLGGEETAVPCLKELSHADACRLAGGIADVGAVREGAVAGRMLRAGLLLRAIAEYCRAGARGGEAGVHRGAARLRELIDELAFEDLSIEELYRRTEMSAAHLGALFAAAYGTTPVAYRQSLRLRRARELLATSQKNVAEVARATGFADPLYFSRVFRKAFGVTPSSLIRSFSGKRALLGGA
jgi:AraC-like DNA-binding protein